MTFSRRKPHIYTNLSKQVLHIIFIEQYLGIHDVISYLSDISINVCHLAFQWLQILFGAFTIGASNQVNNDVGVHLENEQISSQALLFVVNRPGRTLCNTILLYTIIIYVRKMHAANNSSDWSDVWKHYHSHDIGWSRHYVQYLLTLHY